MYYFIFNEDNSYNWHGLEEPTEIMVDASVGQFVVQLPLDCFSEVPEDEQTNVLYQEDSNSIVVDPDRMILPSKRGLELLESDLRAYMLIPPEQRGDWYGDLVDLCDMFLPPELVDEITADSVLSTEEAQQILDYLG
tara:strand:- start:3503 stop:3913 length:411 start_codon:yes stop_codon:yes gene_type:complete